MTATGPPRSAAADGPALPQARAPLPQPDDRPLVLFDGVCNLCNNSVTFVIGRDPEAKVRFAAVQSAPGRTRLAALGLPLDTYESFVLIDGGRAYYKSTAALRLLRHLRQPWPWLAVARIIPRILRDPLYDLIARNRYRWFGKRDACMVPTPDVKARFLDGDFV